jgi:hydrogenase maturation protease
MRIVLIGLGQPLRGDDGAGFAAVQSWARKYKQTATDAQIRIVLTETPGLGLLDLLEDSEAVILVDAISTNVPAGSVQVFSSIPDIPADASVKTAHGLGVLETLALARRTDTLLPSQIALVGIEGRQFKLGEGLSDPVRLAIPKAVQKIQELIASFSSP